MTLSKPMSNKYIYCKEVRGNHNASISLEKKTKVKKDVIAHNISLEGVIFIMYYFSKQYFTKQLHLIQTE